MKIFFLAITVSLFFIACRNEEKKPSSKTATESLETEVLDLHNVGMAKMKKLTKLQQQTQQVIDSIGRLSANAREGSAVYLRQLDSLGKELRYAEFAMEKWMTEFQYDSAKNDAEKRLKYLGDEKNKVSKVKDVILSSIQRADSLLK